MRSGDTVQVRTGALQGAGPQGPIGPQGPSGNTGPMGPQGPVGSFTSLRTDLADTSAVAVAADHWYPASFGTAPTQNDCLVVPAPWDGLNLQWKASGDYLVIVNGLFEPVSGVGDAGTDVSGTRRMRIVDSSGVVLGKLQVKAAAAEYGQTQVIMADVVRPDASKKYHLEVQAADTAGVTFDTRSMTIIQVGAGPAGPAGPQGPVGATGPQGPTGATGSAGGGYSSYNALIGGGDSSAAPGGTTLTTADQALHYPGPTQTPSTPYFSKTLANDVEKLVVARYASLADLNAKRPAGGRAAGEFTYLGDTGTPQFRDRDGTDRMVARVVQSSATPPSGAGAAPPGVIWIQT